MRKLTIFAIATAFALSVGAQQRAGSDALAEYKNLRADTSKASDLLAEARHKGLERSAENMRDLGILLTRATSTDETIQLIGLVASQYKPKVSDSINDEVTQTIKKYARSSDRKVAVAATFSYSRLGYRTDTEQILTLAKERGFFNDDDYYGELAHVVPFADSMAASSIFNRIKKSKNRYALQIVAVNLQKDSPGLANERSALTAARDALLAEPPKFNPALNQFGIGDALEYTEWLFALANLNQRIDGTDEIRTILEHVNMMSGKKIMAFMITDEGRTYAKSFPAATIAAMRSEVEHLLLYRPYPRDQSVEDIGNTVLSYLAQ